MAHPQLRGKAWEDIKAHHRALGRPCGICGYPINYTIRGRHPLSMSVDHIIPKSRGGTNDLSNTMAVHAGCNTAKRDRPLTPELVESCRALYERLTAEPVRYLDVTVDWYNP